MRSIFAVSEMLTRSKVLSHTGLDLSGSKVTVNNHLNISSNSNADASLEQTAQVEPSSSPPSNPYDASFDAFPHKSVDAITVSKASSSSSTVHYDSSNLLHENELLKKIVQLYGRNLVKLSGKLVVHNDELIDLIKFITSADDVDISVDYEVNCFGRSKGLNVVSKISIHKSGSCVDMKYAYNEAYNQLLNYGISLNYTFD